MANFLTFIRIICGLLILIFPAFSGKYYLLYLLGGFTDAIDGTVARKLEMETSFGAKLDTAADVVFALAVIVKLVNAVILPAWLLIWICLIALIKFINIAAGFIRYRHFVTVHSAMNRICGVAVYIAALFVGSSFAKEIQTPLVIAACLIAGVAAISESYKIFTGNISQPVNEMNTSAEGR